MEFEGKVAIVTGAGRGLGEGIALALAREGAHVVVNDVNEHDAQRVAEKITATGRQALAIKADVTSKSEVEGMVAQTLAHFGAIHILVNNAGIEAQPALVRDITETQWDRVLGVNLKGTFLCCQAVIPTMMAQKDGKIINISSIAGLRMSFFGSADYTASKHAVLGLTHHLAWELADCHINVNAICPGGILTPLAEERSTPQMRDFVTRRAIPLGRWCTPEDVAGSVVFLASPQASMITGQALAVEGGVLSGFGEDLRPFMRQRMASADEATAHA
jgi:NAD(P)-dependent dehydrogenase (short-subunit alcohol dehydrogenase family)